MNLQPVLQPRPTANGIGSRRTERELGSQNESKLLMPKPSTGLANGSKYGGLESPSRDRLIYISTCLIGNPVEVHVRNGSVLSGIFHATNAEKDFGIVLKMARIMKDGSVKGPNTASDIVKKPETMIIPGRELVQVITKGVSLTSDGLLTSHAREKRQDLMTDSAISLSHRAEIERELERWTPDKDDPQFPELENIFDRHWNRNWDQFETNKALFGVKSTFNEELYTTKLEKGPQMRELEREAVKIAREIEGEDTKDLHLAEERGLHYDENLDLDEEARFSSVYRGATDDIYRENEHMDDSLGSANNRQLSEISLRKIGDGAQALPSCSSWGEIVSFNPAVADPSLSISVDSAGQLNTHFALDESTEEMQYDDHDGGTDFINRSIARSAAEISKCDGAHTPQDMKKSSSDKGALSASATAYSPFSVQENRDSLNESSRAVFPASESSVNDVFAKLSSIDPHSTSQVRPDSSASSTSEQIGETSTSSCPGLSRSSSVGSLSSNKSTLNVHAKEFKLNPNAKSFVPSASVRPSSPMPESTFYYAPSPGLSHMQGLPVGVGIGPTFPGQQPIIYNPQAMQIQGPQAYISPPAPLYGQQMIVGQHRPFVYMPGYPSDMPLPYKGRDF